MHVDRNITCILNCHRWTAQICYSLRLACSVAMFPGVIAIMVHIATFCERSLHGGWQEDHVCASKLEIPDKCYWGPKRREWPESPLITQTSPCPHHSAMIKTNTGQQGEEKETTRETKSGSRFKGGGAQTEEEWVRKADIHLHRGPSNKMRIMGKDCVRHRQTSWVCVLEVNPSEGECMISLTGDSGAEAEVRATLLT